MTAKASGLREYPLFTLLLLVTAVTMAPFLWVVLSSFKDNAAIFTSSFDLPTVWHWENYTEAWLRGRFYRYVGNSAIITAPTILLTLATAAAAGYAFGKLRFVGQNVLFYCFLAGLTIPAFSLLINLYFTLNSLGLIDRHWGVILPQVATGMPLGIFIMRQFFKELPDELQDSGRIDGASEYQIFGRIMLPMAKPALSALTIFSFMNSWNEFTLPLVVLTTDAKRTIPVGLLYFQDRFTSEYGLMFAAIVISLLPTVFLYMGFQRRFIQGLVGGALK